MLDSKLQIRDAIRERCKELSELDQRNHASSLERLCREAQLALNAKSVAVYLAIEDELNLDPTIEYLWSQAVRVLVPRITEETMRFATYRTDSHLRNNRFGIPEPPEEAEIGVDRFTAVLCPGIAFTKSGDRLGRGGGYYDRFLASSDCMLKIGVGHSCQLVEKLPVDDHDVKLDAVVTENGWRFVSPLAEKHLNLVATDVD